MIIDVIGYFAKATAVGLRTTNVDGEKKKQLGCNNSVREILQQPSATTLPFFSVIACVRIFDCETNLIKTQSFKARVES